jgi:hypothetical protein
VQKLTENRPFFASKDLPINAAISKSHQLPTAHCLLPTVFSLASGI